MRNNDFLRDLQMFEHFLVSVNLTERFISQELTFSEERSVIFVFKRGKFNSGGASTCGSPNLMISFRFNGSPRFLKKFFFWRFELDLTVSLAISDAFLFFSLDDEGPESVAEREF